MLKMKDINLKGKRVLIREDLNVPMKDGEITSDARIQAVLPTLKWALDQKAAVMVMSHLGRPSGNGFEPDLSLQPIAIRLSQLLKKTVRFESDWLNGVDIEPGEIVLLENVRFNRAEVNNDLSLAKKMGELCDVFVMDAFATAHRAESSTVGICQFAPIACAGPLLLQEVEALDSVMQKPKRPVVAIVGGSKVSTKLKLLESLAQNVDTLIVGGGIANTFLAANGYAVGGSLYEPDLVDEAERVMKIMKERGAYLPLPIDVVVAERMTDASESYDEPVAQVADDEKIFDIGPETTALYTDIIKKAKTILWNGPVGAFEIDQFAAGTKAIAMAVAQSQATSVAGGGDTIAAIDKYGLVNKISYISTGGGAFLAYLEGKELPAIAALRMHVENPPPKVVAKKIMEEMKAAKVPAVEKVVAKEVKKEVKKQVANKVVKEVKKPETKAEISVTKAKAATKVQRKEPTKKTAKAITKATKATKKVESKKPIKPVAKKVKASSKKESKKQPKSVLKKEVKNASKKAVKQTAKKSVKKVDKKPVKQPAKKTVKTAIKKPAKPVKPTKKTAKPAAKKEVKKGVKQVVKPAAKKAVSKTKLVKKASKPAVKAKAKSKPKNKSKK